MKGMLITLIFFLAALASFVVVTPAVCCDVPCVARWYRNYEGAVSLRFDDTLESHITKAIPLLNRYGFKATFMVNPGTIRYRSHREFWEERVPAMGHRLGDHTMNHRGAWDLAGAEYEIGEAARVIRRADLHQSKLIVFASGGGEKWGGRDWEQAEPPYRQLVNKYQLIDLYDGQHNSYRVDARSRINELCSRLDRTMAESGYQPFHFHNIGSPSLVNYIRGLIMGVDLTTRTEIFSGFLQCLSQRSDRLWVAPLTDILKYEEEASGAGLRVVKSSRRSITLELAVETDPVLYDHELTIILPQRKGLIVRKVTQGDEALQVYRRVPGENLVDVRPVNSTITVILTAG